MDGRPDRGNPTRRTNDLGNVGSAPRASSNAHQECREANSIGKSEVTGRARDRQAEAWHAATGLARNLELLGLSVRQCYELLDALLPRGWDSEAGIVLSNDESGRRLRELGFLASATAIFLVLGRVAHTDASQAGLLLPAAMPTLCRNRCGRLTNVRDVTCCHTCHMEHHSAQCLERQLTSQDLERNAMRRSSRIHNDQDPALTTNSQAQRGAAPSEDQLRGGFGSAPTNEQARQRHDIGLYRDGGMCSA